MVGEGHSATVKVRVMMSGSQTESPETQVLSLAHYSIESRTLQYKNTTSKSPATDLYRVIIVKISDTSKCTQHFNVEVDEDAATLKVLQTKP